MAEDKWSSATAVLRLATELIDGIQEGVNEEGFDDVRSIHGFAFARLSESPTTTVQLARHLGITKQATSEMVTHLIERGYLTRSPDPTDGRASLLVLTDRGHACTRAARRAAAATVAVWEQRIPVDRRQDLREMLDAVSIAGRLRPTW